MLSIQNAIINYDKDFDILLYRQPESPNSYGDDISDNITELKDIDTEETKGYMIMNFSRLCKMKDAEYFKVSQLIPLGDVFNIVSIV